MNVKDSKVTASSLAGFVGRSLVMISMFLTAPAFSQVHPKFQNLQDNTLVDLGLYTCTPPAGEDANECVKITDFSGFVFDSARRQMLMFGGGHATTFTDTIAAFNLTDLTWRQIYTPTPCSSMTLSNVDFGISAWLDGPSGPYPRPFATHTYDLMAVVGNELVMASSGSGRGSCAPSGNSDNFIATGKIAHFNLVTEQWRFTSADRFWRGFPGMELDPRSGNLILLGRDKGLEIYNPADASYSNPLPNVGDVAMGIEGTLVYSPKNDRFYYFASNDNNVKVWEIALDRNDFSRSNVVRVDTSGTPPSNQRGFAYDSLNGIIGGGISGNTFYAFDPDTSSWTSQVMQGGNAGIVAFFAFDYDPVNAVFIFIDDKSAFEKRTWAYRYRNFGTPAPAPKVPEAPGDFVAE